MGVFVLGWLIVMAASFLYAGISEKAAPSFRLKPYSSNQLLIQFKTSLKPNDLTSKNSSGNFKLDSLNSLFQLKEIIPLCAVIKNSMTTNESVITAQIYLFKFANVSSLANLKKSYEALEIVELVEFNYYYFAENLKSTNVSSMLQLQLEEATHNLDYRHSVIIGIIDTGIDWQKENLRKNIWQNQLEKPDGIDNDTNGLVDDIWGWNFVDKDLMNQLKLNWESRPADYSGHGDQIADAITQLCNYRTVNKENDVKNKIMILKAGAPAPDGKLVFTAFATAQAIVYAADHGARIINISCNSENFSQVFQLAINYAVQKGCVIIAAAGDKNSNLPHYPAAFENVWAVSATGDNDNKLEDSNYGYWIDLTAPGLPQQNFSQTDSTQLEPSGTAIAAANVSGLAGLLLSYQDIVDNDSLKRRILWSSDNIYPKNLQYSGNLGTGRINVLRAINSQNQPNIVIQKFSCHLKSNIQNLFAFSVVPVRMSITNLSSTAQNVNIKLTTEDPYLSVTKSEINLSNLFFKQEFTNESDPFMIVVNNDCPPGHKANLSVSIVTSNGFSLEQSFVFANWIILPKHLSIIDQNPVHLTWTGDPELIGYYIYRKQGEEPSYSRINALPVSNSTYIDLTTQRGFQYSYFVTGIDSSGWESPSSDVVSIMLRDTPKFLFYPAQNTVISNYDSIRFTIFPQLNDAENYSYQWMINGKPVGVDSICLFIDSYDFQNSVCDTVLVSIVNFESNTTINHKWILSLRNDIQNLKIRSVFPASDTTLSVGDSLIFLIGLDHGYNDSLKFRWQINDKIIESETDSLFVLLTDSLFETKNLVKVSVTNNDTTVSYNWNIYIKPLLSTFKRFIFTPKSDTTISSRDTVLFFINAYGGKRDLLSYRWFINQTVDSTAVDSFYRFFKFKVSSESDTISVQISDNDTSIFHHWIVHYLVNQNQAPQFVKYSPSIDSILTKADSLLFVVQCQDRDGDALRFYWSLNGRIDTTAHDSTYWYHILEPRMSNDTLNVVVADEDTSVMLKWIIRPENVVPGLIGGPLNWFPEQDTLIARGDSLIFLVRNASDSCRFQWQINSHVDSTANDSVFVYSLKYNSNAIDTIQVIALQVDSIFSHQWYIHYFNLNPQPSPLLLAFKPAQNVITTFEDSLRFSVQILDGNFAELDFLWSVNSRLDTTAVDTFFYYNPEQFHAAPDTIRLMVSGDGATLSHQWIVVFYRRQSLSTPRLLFPIKGNRICEEDKLMWEEDSMLVKADSTGNWKYIVQLARDTTFLNVISLDTCITSSIQLNDLSRFDLIPVGKPLFWQVKAFSDEGETSEFCKCAHPFYYYPQFAQIENFYGQKNKDETIDLFWITGYEANCAGFNVYRSESQNDNFEKVNGSLITGKTNYLFQDGLAQAGKTYYYKLEDVSLNGKKKFHFTISVSMPKPDKFSLWQNYPNPFNTQTAIKYEIPTAVKVKIIVCNVLGRKVRTLVDENKEAGFYTVFWDGVDDQGENVVSGIYFYSLSTAQCKQTRKMVVVR